MDERNKYWWMFPRWTDEYEQGVDNYVKNAFEFEAQGEEIRCPCKKCCYRYWFRGDIVKDHVIVKGFVSMSEKEPEFGVDALTDDHGGGICINGDIDGLLRDTSKCPNEETEKFYKLMEEGQQELYLGCKNFSKLSFIVRLFVFKCDHKLSNATFFDLLELLKAMQPDAKLPSSFSEAKNILKVLGLDYTKIDACPNDCMLYWEEHEDALNCHVCKASRWKSKGTDEKIGKCSQIPAKVLRYFPIKKRLQRLYMCSETTHLMSWHSNGRTKDGLLRHPVDGA